MKHSMKLHNLLFALLMLPTVVGIVSCEKAVFDEEKPEQQSKNANLILKVTGQQVSEGMQTRAMVDITTYSKYFNFVLYKDGKKVKSITQKKGDAGFGEVALSLEPDTYKLLVLAHSGNGGNPTVSDPENIQFTNTIGYSDTFYYYDDITVTKETQTHNITLKRAVSKITFIVNDEWPDSVAFFHFYYTGGSGVLNAATGMGGNVNSKQEKRVEVTNAKAPMKSSLYTFLQQQTGKIQLKVKALKADATTVVYERSFSDIPVEYQKETILEGDFFNHFSNNSFSFTAETDWEVLEKVTF